MVWFVNGLALSLVGNVGQVAGLKHFAVSGRRFPSLQVANDSRPQPRAKQKVRKKPESDGDRTAPTDIVLGSMHSYVNIPVTPGIYQQLVPEINMNATWSDQIATSEDTLEAIRNSLEGSSRKLDRNLTGRHMASIHWNIPGASSALGVESFDVNEYNRPNVYLKAQLHMHPKCAWAIIRMLSRLYNFQQEHDKRQPRRVRNGFQDAFVEAALGGLNVGAAKGSSLDLCCAGMRDKGNKHIFEKIATQVPWASLMNYDNLNCVAPRSIATVMDPDPHGVCCWHFVIDVRDLMMSAWQADAWMLGCELTDGDCCDQLTNQLFSYFREKGNWGDRLKGLIVHLGNTLLDFFRNPLELELDSPIPFNRLRKIATLLVEAAASRKLGDIPKRGPASNWTVTVTGCLSGLPDDLVRMMANEEAKDTLGDRETLAYQTKKAAEAGVRRTGWAIVQSFGMDSRDKKAPKPEQLMTPEGALRYAVRLIEFKFKAYAVQMQRTLEFTEPLELLLQ